MALSNPTFIAVVIAGGLSMGVYGISYLCGLSRFSNSTLFLLFEPALFYLGSLCFRYVEWDAR